MIIQVLLSVSALILAYRHPIIHLLISAANVILVVFIVNSSISSAFKIGWVVLFCLFPIIGGSLYLLSLITSLVIRKKRDPERLFPAELPSGVPNGFQGLSRFICRSGGFPLYPCEDCSYFQTGELMFRALLNDIENAHTSIYLEFYIISDGFMFDRVAKLLMDKASKGLDVRVLYDGVGTGFSRSNGLFRRLAASGVKCRVFNRFTPFLIATQNNRDHRKIVVIDGTTTFSGGANIADEYINLSDKYGHWKDSAIRIKGAAAKSYTAMFMELWDNNDLSATVPLPPASSVITDAFIQPFSISPYRSRSTGKQVYLEIIRNAQKFVHITTPYFLPDDELTAALCTCALKGVEVCVILPGIADKSFVQTIARNSYFRLIETGVRIFEYTPGFIHSKNISADGTIALVGTINLDCRSMYLQYETAAVMYGCTCIKDIEEDFAYTLGLSEEMTREYCMSRSIKERFIGYFLNLLSPLF